MAVIAMLTLVLMISLGVLDAVTDVDVGAIVDWQRSTVVVRLLTMILGLIGPSSVVTLWVLMLHHWRKYSFKTQGQKSFWLAVLLLGNIVFAPVYYLAIFERGVPAEDKREEHGS
jgi:hypothetical protein